jgi:anaerobic selenocysteine-containing dehydrogenase
VVLASYAVRNVVKYSEPVVEPEADTKEDWEILYELGMRLGGLRFGLGPADKAVRAAWKLGGLKLHPDKLVDAAVRMGAWGDKWLPRGKGLSLKKIRQAPHGIDLGPLEPSLKAHLHTPSGKVELAPARLVEQRGRLERFVEGAAAGGGELVLIGRRHVRTNNSWMHNCRSLTKGPDRAQLIMNAGDAGRAGLKDGQRVKVSSRIGAVEAVLSASDDVMPGVVSLPHGYGHAAVSDTMKVAGALPGPNVNVLVDDGAFEPIIGTAILNGVPVKVEAASGAGAVDVRAAGAAGAA